MPSGRGVLVFGAGIALWVAARMLGSPTLHMVSVGIVLLPFAAALFARFTSRQDDSPAMKAGAALRKKPWGCKVPSGSKRCRI